MATNGGTTLVMCKFCNNEQVKTCARCKSLFCAIHAAKFSPNFCKDCLSNITAVWEKFTKTTTEYDSVTDTLIVIPSGSMKFHVDGAGWVFYSSWIDQLNDDELQMVYEFHYFILKLIEHDNEVRKVKKARTLANAPSPMGIITTKETRVRKSTEQKDMQTELEKLGLKPDVVKSMCLAAGISYREAKA